jgi:hypothetical protein
VYELIAEIPVLITSTSLSVLIIRSLWRALLALAVF